MGCFFVWPGRFQKEPPFCPTSKMVATFGSPLCGLGTNSFVLLSWWGLFSDFCSIQKLCTAVQILLRQQNKSLSGVRHFVPGQKWAGTKWWPGPGHCCMGQGHMACPASPTETSKDKCDGRVESRPKCLWVLEGCEGWEMWSTTASLWLVVSVNDHCSYCNFETGSHGIWGHLW